MDAILNQLVGLLLKALPTFLLLLLLHFYLKHYFFRPLEKVLSERHKATEGARAEAQASLERASRKTDEYEAALRAARSDVYREHEEARRRWRDEQGAAVKQTRAKTEALVAEARAQIAEEAKVARQSLYAESDMLAARIAEAILKGARN